MFKLSCLVPKKNSICADSWDWEHLKVTVCAMLANIHFTELSGLLYCVFVSVCGCGNSRTRKGVGVFKNVSIVCHTVLLVQNRKFMIPLTSICNSLCHHYILLLLHCILHANWPKVMKVPHFHRNSLFVSVIKFPSDKSLH